jgi:hypothetical protein
MTVYNAFDPVKAKAVRPGIFKLCTIGLFENLFPNCFLTNKIKKKLFEND